MHTKSVLPPFLLVVIFPPTTTSCRFPLDSPGKWTIGRKCVTLNESFFHQKVFQRFETREASLTTVESFCIEGIMAMGEPTIAEFSRMMQISTPNVAYKINSLVQKGYLEKVQSPTDRREYHLRPTQKYVDYYNISCAYLHTVVERAKETFPPEDLKKLEEMLTVINRDLMPELSES